MKVTVSAVRPGVAYGTVRQVLLALGSGSGTVGGREARDLRLYFPFDTRLAERARQSAVSLTDSSTPADQLRYFQARRLLGNHLRVARVLTERHGSVEVKVQRAGWVDDGSLEFFRSAAACAGWQVELSSGSDARCSLPGDTPESELVLDAFGRACETDAQDLLVRAAHDCLNVGDARTAMSIALTLQEYDRSARVWNIAALASAMLGRSLEAGRYYELWGAAGGDLDRARAMYGQAMLYTRHHIVALRDANRAAELLDRGEKILSRIIAAEPGNTAAVFDWVFNRNGYALILFRRGEAEEALAMLEDGIEKLTVDDPRVGIHRSVLIYNMAQCHMALHDAEAARCAFDRLFDVDPYMPEYHLEFARCSAQAGDFDQAVVACRRALELDSTMSVAWRLLGLYLAQSGQPLAAADSYGQAAAGSLMPEGALADRLLCLVTAGETTSAELLADSLLAEPTLPEHERVRVASLRAELALRNGDRVGAIRIIADAIERAPRAPVLRANHARLLCG